MLGAIRKLTENIDDNIDPKIKEEAVKNISILHDGDDGFIAIAAKKGKEYVQYHYKVDDLAYNIGKAISLNANIYMTSNSFFMPKRKIENIRKLNITEDEMKSLITIICPKEKKRRQLVKERASRRNEEGLTSREQQKQDRLKEILTLKEQGLEYFVVWRYPIFSTKLTLIHKTGSHLFLYVCQLYLYIVKESSWPGQ